MKFTLDRQLVSGIIIILAILFALMVAFSLIDGVSMRPIIFLVIVTALLALLWSALARGTYIVIEGDNLTVSRAFFKHKPTALKDVVSVETRPALGGLVTNVYMKVRSQNGTLRNQGLINKPGLTDSEYRHLVNAIRAANPHVPIDPSITT